MTPHSLPAAPPPTPVAVPARPAGPPTTARPPETTGFGHWLDQARGAAKGAAGSPPAPKDPAASSSPPASSDGATPARASERDTGETETAAAPLDDRPDDRHDDRAEAAPDAPDAPTSAGGTASRLAVVAAADPGEASPAVDAEDATGAEGPRATARRGALPGLRGNAADGGAAAAVVPGDAGTADPAPGGPAAGASDPTAPRPDPASVAAGAHDGAGARAAAARPATDARAAAATAQADGSAPSLVGGQHAAAPGSPGAAGAAGAAGATAMPDGTARAAAPAADTLQAPLHSPTFAPALAARVIVMLREGTREARLQLNPAELGPIGVRISVDGTQARVDLVADQAPTRSVLEQALPSLAGALRDSGLTLSGGGVFDAPRDGQRGAQEAPAGRRGMGTAGADDGLGDPATQAAIATRPALRGVLDLYA